MALETEIKLSLPPRLVGKLAGHPLLVGVKPLTQRLLNTYHDTPDLSLQQARVAVRYRRKGRDWLLTVKCAAPSAGGLAQRNEWEAPGVPGEFDFSHIDNDKLRKLLESLRSELTPAFTTDFTRSAWLIEPRPGVRIEIALDRGYINAGGQCSKICEVELELIAGEVGDLFRTAAALQETLPLHPAATSKAERGYRLFTGAPLHPTRAQPTQLGKRTPPIAAFRTIALACLQHLQENEEGLRTTDTPEFIHQSRVAIRRLRSAIGAWKPLLPRDFTRTFEMRWRTLATSMSGTRNWDVFVGEILPPLAEAFPSHVAVSQLKDRIEQRLTENRKTTRAAACSPEYSKLLLDFAASLFTLQEADNQSLGSLARRTLNKRAKRVKRLAQAVTSGGEGCHRLRIALKRLRYALEFLAPLYDDHRLQHYQRAVVPLLDLLGRMNDLMVAGECTSALLSGNQGDLVHGWLAGRHALLRNELDEKLAHFLQQPAPWQHT